MKFFLSLAFIACLTSLAPAAPYIVYSGTVSGKLFNSTGNVSVPANVLLFYLVTDVADTSNYSLLQAYSTTKVYFIDSRPGATPSVDESNNNFFGGLITSNGKSGMGVFSYSSSPTDTSGNTLVSHAYATGALTLKNLSLASARTKPVVVSLKTNGVASGTYTFSTLTPAITAGNYPIPKALSGTLTVYSINADGALTNATTQATLTLTENASLTSLANIGGGFTSGKNTVALQPITIPDGTSETDAFSTFLTAFAQASGFTQ